jgi:hypothetical protein
MARNTYTLNETIRDKPLDELITVDLATKELPDEFLIDWGHFFSGITKAGPSATPAPSEPIDTSITPALGKILRYSARIFSNLALQPPDDRKALADVPELPARTLIRGAYMRLPTGQQVAKALCMKELSVEQLTGVTNDEHGRVDKAGQKLLDLHLEHDTPLFYYVLRDSETISACGNHLGTMGSRIVADVIDGVLQHDPQGYWKKAGKDWHPPDWTFPDGSSRPVKNLKDLVNLLGNE